MSGKKKERVNNLTFSIPNNKENEEDSEYSIHRIVEATSNNKTDFMYSVILSGNEKRNASRLHREGVIMAGKIKNNKHLINAPAGSGKTTYIRNELKSICLNNPESRILCITYTNRAANELKKNLEGANITVSTIHSYINDLISPFYSHKEALDLYWEIYAEKDQ